MGIILVTHDLGVVAQVCDRVVVMYGGVVAEENDAARSSPRRSIPTRSSFSARSRTLAPSRSCAARHPRFAAPPRCDAGRVPVRAALPAGIRRCHIEIPARLSRRRGTGLVLPAGPGARSRWPGTMTDALLRSRAWSRNSRARSFVDWCAPAGPPVRAVDNISFELRPGEISPSSASPAAARRRRGTC